MFPLTLRLAYASAAYSSYSSSYSNFFIFFRLHFFLVFVLFISHISPFFLKKKPQKTPFFPLCSSIRVHLYFDLHHFYLKTLFLPALLSFFHVSFHWTPPPNNNGIKPSRRIVLCISMFRHLNLSYKVNNARQHRLSPIILFSFFPSPLFFKILSFYKN